MARLTNGQKAHRVLKLLMGLRNPRILGALASRGFEEEDAEEGWRLLRSIAKFRFDALPPSKADSGQLGRLDEWENTWFPVADATLKRRFPEVHRRVFLNLSQTEGPAVIVSVGTFLERVTALGDGDDRSQKAAELLARRGLNDAVLGDARSLLTQLGKRAPEAPPPDLEALREETLAAIAELWSWYLEWSRIARGVITDRGLLRELGFLGSRDGTTEDEEAEEGDGEAPTETVDSRAVTRKR